MPQPDFVPRSSINDEYWKAYIDHGAIWRRFTAGQRAEILALPVLRHDSIRTHQDPATGEIERRPEIIRLLLAIDCDPKFAPFHLLIRLVQVCHAAGDAFAPGRDPAEIGRHLVRHVLTTEAGLEFNRTRPTSWWGGGHPLADVELDLARFASRARFRSFLAIPPDQNGVRWESAQRQYSAGMHSLAQFSGQLVCGFARRILERLAAAPGPLPLPELLGQLGFDPKQRGLVAKALRALCQYVFTIADYDHDRGDLRLGLWPGLSQRLADTCAAPAPPAAAPPPATIFHDPFFCADIAQVIASAAANPIPLKRQARVEIFAAKARELATQFAEVPEWVGDGLFKGPERAVAATLSAWSFGWLDLESRRFRLAASQAGRDWLALAPSRRLQSLLDLLRLRRWGSRHWSSGGWNFSELTGRVRLTPSDDDILACEDEIAAAFLDTPGDAWLDVACWLDCAARTRNPIAAVVGPDATVCVARPDEWRGLIWVRREAELLEDEAFAMLADFLFKRLIPLGGAELGRGAGKSTVFRLTGFGRYYLGARRDFPALDDSAAGRVVVQPNFEVMFLGRNLLAEADLAGFCERIGHHTGAVLRITRQSVQQALHAGSSAESILATLRRIGDRELPANVAAEIAGWAGSRRTYHTGHAILIRCPDATVALRIHGLLPAITRPLNDTVLELSSPLTSPQRRKLEAAGMFQQQPAEPDDDPPPPTRPRRGRRRRW